MSADSSEEDKNPAIKELKEQYNQCKKNCDELALEIKKLKEFDLKNSIEGTTLDTSKKLIDLLINRILDPSSDWKTKIDTLINIPPSIEGNYLRGGDYFEALFQLAIVIGIAPGFTGKKLNFHDIDKDYKTIIPRKNYLYEKTIRNSGGGEHGVSDMTFEVVEDKPKDPKNNNKDEGPHIKDYKCGEVYVEPTIDKKGLFYFTSVKGFKNEKSIKNDYDIPLLDQQLRNLKGIEDKSKHIIVCVKNRDEFIKRLNRSRIEFLKNSVDKVIGYDEIMNAFENFRINFFIRLENKEQKAIENEVKYLFPENVIYKPSLSLYFHQELIVESVIQRIGERKQENDKRIEEKKQENVKPHFMCIGVLPRGGKSFIAGGIINKHRKILNEPNYNVLFLTSAVNETREQFDSDLINKFSEFSDFEFIDVVKNSNKQTNNPNNFYFVSRQLSSNTSESNEEQSPEDIFKLFSKVKDKINICFFDEAHVGIKSENVRTTFQKAFEKYKVPIIMMTATYIKPSNVLEDNKDLFVWDLQDVKDMRDLPVLKLDGFKNKEPDMIIRYPNIINILKKRIELGESLDKIAKPYIEFPSPNFISLTFTDETIQYLKDTGEGYDFTKAFQFDQRPSLNDDTNYTEWWKLLSASDEALRLREFLTPDLETDDNFLIGKNRKFRALNQIFQIAYSTKSRPLPGQPFSMIMFLPILGQGMPVGALCRIWASFMYNSPYWKNNFVFMSLSTYNHKDYKKITLTEKQAVVRGLCSRENFNEKSLKKVIKSVELEALKQGKGLVLLSGDVAKMGISLPCVDVVCLMSNNTDPDDIIQKMYRALTDNPPNKKNGFIIDLNLKRIIKAMFDYDIVKTQKNPNMKQTLNKKERLEKLFELCNWGQDSFIQASANQKNFDDIMNEIRDKIFLDLESRISTSFSREVLEKKQIDVIINDKDLKSKMSEILRDTIGNKKSKNNKVNLSNNGKNIPEKSNQTSSSENESSDQTETTTDQSEVPNQVYQLTETEQTEKMMKIVTTFINALVIKSSEPWDKTTTFKKLIDKYKVDKETAEEKISCECSKESKCNKVHDNLYEIAYCELYNYAFKRTFDNKIEYNNETHKQIMLFLDELLEKSKNLELEWDGHIDELISSLQKQKTGGRKQRTWKNKLHKIRNGNRTRRSIQYNRKTINY